jgi:hypothetical protein
VPKGRGKGETAKAKINGGQKSLERDNRAVQLKLERENNFV